MKISGPTATGLRIFFYTSIFLLGIQAFHITVTPSPLANIYIYFVILLITPGDIIAYLLSQNMTTSNAVIIAALAPFLAALCWAILGYGIHKIIRKRKTPNNRFQGTLHKVSGPLNRDVGIFYAAYK